MVKWIWNKWIDLLLQSNSSIFELIFNCCDFYKDFFFPFSFFLFPFSFFLFPFSFFPFPFSLFLFPLLSRFYKLCRSRSCRILIPNNRFIFLCRNVNIVVRLEPLWAVVNLAVQWIIILCAHEMLKPSSKTTRRCTVLNIPSGPKRRLVVLFTSKARIT